MHLIRKGRSGGCRRAMWSGNADSFIPCLASLRNSTLNTAGLSAPPGTICNRSENVRFTPSDHNSFQRVPVKRPWVTRSEEHTSELQSPCNLVCRLLLEKKNKKRHTESRR